MNILYAGTLTEEQHRLLNALALKTANGRVIPLHYIAGLFGVISVLLGLVFHGYWLYFGFATLFFAAMMWRSQRRALAANTSARQYRSGEITEQGFSINTTDSNGHLSWQAVTSASIGTDEIVLFTGPSIYFGFAKSFFGNDEDWNTFHNYISQRFPPPPGQKLFPTLSKSMPRWLVSAIIALAIVFFIIVVYLGAA